MSTRSQAIHPPSVERPSGAGGLVLALIAGTMAFFVPSLGAQDVFPTEDVILGRGLDFDTQKVFPMGDFDQVNLFNGNLTATVPIGPSYPVGPGFSYSLTLVNNSNLWDARQVPCPEGNEDCPPGCGGEPWIATQMWPQRDSNAGIGWKLSLGELHPPNLRCEEGTSTTCIESDTAVNKLNKWVYISPDGGRHVFYPKLHHDVESPASDAALLRYTNDGSYLRFVDEGFDSAVGRHVRVVESGDGVRRRFEAFQVDAGPEPLWQRLEDWRLTRIEDRFGNSLEVTFPDPIAPVAGDGVQDSWRWVLQDSHGRSHTIYFVEDTTEQEPEVRPRGLVTKVVLEAFGGQLAEYTFHYGTDSAGNIGTRIRRGCGHSDDRLGLEIVVPLLTRVDLPETDPSEDRLSFSFRYRDLTLSDPVACGVDQPGALESMTLPTGGSVAWEYGSYSFPQNQEVCDLAFDGFPRCGPQPLFLSLKAGVTARHHYPRGVDPTAPGATPSATWTYQPAVELAMEDCPTKAESFSYGTYSTRTVTNPVGEQTVHYFSTFAQKGDSGNDWPTADGLGWKTSEYGLPFTRTREVAAEDVFLSTERFDRSGTRVRTKLVRYEQDPIPPASNCAISGDNCADTNPRLVKSLTGFEFQPGSGEDGEASRITALSEFDGFGNFRKTVERAAGNFTVRGSSRREMEDRINPGQVYPEGSQGGMSLPGASEPWWLTFSEGRRVTQDGRTSETRTCYDGNKFPVKTRVLESGSGLGQDDLLTVRVPRVIDAFGTTDGFTAAERLYGGDADDQPLPTSTAASRCGDTPSFAAVRRIEHTYEAGVLESSTLKADDDGRNVLVTVDQDIDGSTGLIATERDGAGVATVFGYDALGRVVRRTLAGEASTLIDYSPPGPSSPATLTVSRSGAGDSTQTTLTYDGFGRIVEEAIRYPGFTAKRDADYDALGRTLSVSEFGTNAPSPERRFFTRDHDGRPTVVTRPDGTELRFRYQGVRVISREVEIDGATSTTTATLDGFGRVVRVTEPSGPAGAPVHTDYQYDEGDRLTRVQTTAQVPSGASVTQTRQFVYDGRGFLLCESHPELGASGTPCNSSPTSTPDGTVRYSDYDALGNAGRVDTNRRRVLDASYDPAGRLLRVEQGGVVLQENFYAVRPPNPDQNADKRGGKLVYAKRHNLLPAPGGGETTYTVAQAFEYKGGPGSGHLSRSELRSTSGRRFVTSLEYDALGRVTSIDYPACASPDCAASSAMGLGPSFSYSSGLLAGVSERRPAPTAPVALASRLTYHPSGLLHQVTHGGFVDVTDADPDAMPRPGGIRFRRNGADYLDLGEYSYDAAGNITAIEETDPDGNPLLSRTYDYDLVGRLVRGSALTEVGLADETAGFDAFGNLTSLSTGGGAIGVDHATNRLLPPAVYDELGNLTGGLFSISSIRYGPFDRPFELRGEGVFDRYLYDPDGNRAATLDLQEGNRERWTVRSPAGKVLREYEVAAGGGATWTRDNFYRGGRLLASRMESGLRHYHLDHLGSTRLVTDGAGNEVARFEYFPFGNMALETGDEGPAREEKLRFTGHERDFHCEGDACVGESNDDLDYMLARYYSPVRGRFLSMDEVPGRTSLPQSWNRYAYTRGNPLRLVDSDGRDPEDAAREAKEEVALAHFQSLVNDGVSQNYALKQTIKRFPGVRFGRPNNPVVAEGGSPDGALRFLGHLETLVTESTGFIGGPVSKIGRFFVALASVAESAASADAQGGSVLGASLAATTDEGVAFTLEEFIPEHSKKAGSLLNAVWKIGSYFFTEIAESEPRSFDDSAEAPKVERSPADCIDDCRRPGNLE